VLVNQPTVSASEGKPKHAKVTDNLGSYNKSVTDPDPVNPVSPVLFCFFFFNVEFRKKEISRELDVDM